MIRACVNHTVSRALLCDDFDEPEQLSEKLRERRTKRRSFLSCLLWLLFPSMVPMPITKKDIDLAENVRKHPPLYDKSQKEFKNKPMNKFIWKTIATSLGLKSGKNVIYLIC